MKFVYRTLIIMVAAAIILVCGLAMTAPEAREIEQAGPPVAIDGKAMENLTILLDSGKTIRYRAELARTPEEHMYGLMNRKEMPEDHAMLFIFRQEAERNFWMKNTLIPLDMIFIRADGTILTIHENARPNDLTPVPSRGPALAVLEVNAGQVKRHGIREGNRVRHRIFAP